MMSKNGSLDIGLKTCQKSLPLHSEDTINTMTTKINPGLIWTNPPQNRFCRHFVDKFDIIGVFYPVPNFL